jgi:hypothetical protein
MAVEEEHAHDSPWIRLTLVDVEPPGHERFEHHVARLRDAAGCLPVDGERDEAERVAWHGWDSVRKLVTTGQVPDGPSLLALSFALAALAR